MYSPCRRTLKPPLSRLTNGWGLQHVHALRQPADHKDSIANNGLSIAKSAFAAPSGFGAGRLDAVLRGPCQTRPKPPAVLSGVAGLPGGDGLARRADHDLAVRLCRMPADLAAPLLRSSLPALNPAALLTVLAATGEDHHRLIAARPHLDWRVVKAVIRRAKPSALLALVDNTTLTLDDDDQRALCAAATHLASLRDALLRRPDLGLAHRLIDPAPESLSHNNLKLLKLVRAGQMASAAQEIARRLKLDAIGMASALDAGSAVPLALAVCALGLDRAVFLDLLHSWQTTQDGRPALSPGHRPLVLSVFALSPAEARLRLLASIS